MTENAHLDDVHIVLLEDSMLQRKMKDLVNKSCKTMCFVINNCDNHSAYYKPSNTMQSYTLQIIEFKSYDWEYSLGGFWYPNSLQENGKTLLIKVASQRACTNH